MANTDNFRIFYNQSIQPELVRLDKQRRQLLRRMFFTLLLWAGIAVLLFYLQVFVFALYALIPFGIYLYVMTTRFRKFVLTFKPRVVKLILDFIDDGLLFGDLKYNPKGKIELKKFLWSSLFGARPAVYEGEDYIEGRIGDVEFEMCELRVQEFSRVRARLDDVFRGVFIRSKFFAPLKGAMLVLPKKELPQLSEAVRDFVRNGGQAMDGFVRHEEFRKVYTIYGSRHTKVADLLPDELMDFMLQYRKKKGEVYLSLFGKNCYVALSSKKDILEPKLFQSNVSFDLVREFYEDIDAALFMVMALDRSH
ncbi:MAG: DUF3137 domain-containing protein [Lewinellaceae bacterium]|nr:DUF3137 domain-containing protein [Lewinellaceae bacterium]